jgi:DNA-binding XRE family transcriptional regulator
VKDEPLLFVEKLVREALFGFPEGDEHSLSGGARFRYTGLDQGTNLLGPGSREVPTLRLPFLLSTPIFSQGWQPKSILNRLFTEKFIRLISGIMASKLLREGVRVATVERSVKISGAKLMRVREHELLSRQELADKAGMHLDHLARIERGEIANPHMRTIRRLVDALGVPVSEITEEE